MVFVTIRTANGDYGFTKHRHYTAAAAAALHIAYGVALLFIHSIQIQHAFTFTFELFKFGFEQYEMYAEKFFKYSTKLILYGCHAKIVAMFLLQ